MSHNDITGDRIATKPSKAYEDNYDAVFRKGYRAATPEEEEFVRLTIKEAESCPMCDVYVIEEMRQEAS